ncbi:hypothetical protein EJD97_017051 [Solanum chilense]|uniref:Uncharacterized protein n=1 Tax=Solanum chilense TaxID=4083 RepID=A0A6N2C6J5_SOLCI|nr:hypothetical protein EJD97_017051 [Solanum chilense]
MNTVVRAAKERIPPRVDQVPIVCLYEKNKEVHLQETQVPPESQGRQVPQRLIRRFHEDEPSNYHGTKVDEDPQGFKEEIFKVVDAMGVTLERKRSYRLTNSKMWLKCGFTNEGLRDPEIRQQSPRSGNSSHQKPKKRLYHQDSSMGNKDKAPNKNFQKVGHSFERTRCPTCGKEHLGWCVAGKDVWFTCGNKVYKMRYCPNIKQTRKDVNQSSLDPNAPKRKLPMG